MILLDGKSLSNKIKEEIKEEIENNNYKLSLVDISIDEDDATKVYIRNKEKACEKVGINFKNIHFDSSIREEEIINKIKELNNDENINGIIVQLPIPKKYDKNKILNTISPLKDIDGLTTSSVGNRMNNLTSFVPCTPKGIIEILDEYNISLSGKNVVVVGRSNLVGKPIMLECLKRDATCTICHSKTYNLASFTKNADILIVAVGHKSLITKDMVKDNAVVIDVGINSVDGKLYGDVDSEVENICSYKTPVPGGVGPMTVAMLLKNTLIAYKLQRGINE